MTEPVFNQTTYRHPDSYTKTLWQLSIISKGQDIQVRTRKPFLAPTQFSISQSFFRVWGCYLNCGACCAAVSLDYLPSEVPGVLKTYPFLTDQLVERETLPINGKVYSVFSVPQEPQVLHGKTFCRFTNPSNGGCGIHLNNPYSCRVELTKFRKVKHRGYLMKGPYGRSWTMVNVVTGKKRDLKCTFNSSGIDATADQIINSDLPVLRRLNNWAYHFGIETYLPEVIAYLQAGNTEPRRFS